MGWFFNPFTGKFDYFRTDAEIQAAAVEDAAYGAGWNGDTSHAPSQNAVYDELVSHYADTDEHHAQSHKDTHDPQTGGDPLDCAAPGTNITPEQTNAEGSADTIARSDHMHYLPSGTPSTIAAANAEGTGAAFARTDHIHQREHAKYTDSEAKAAAVSDTAYGAGWNGVTDVAPSKNAVYDKIEAIGGVVFTDYKYYVDLAALASYTPAAQSLATLFNEKGTLDTAGIHIEFHDGAGWVDAHTGIVYESSCPLNQDNAQSLRITAGATGFKIMVTGVVWS